MENEALELTAVEKAIREIGGQHVYSVIFVSEKTSLAKSRITGVATPADKDRVTVVKKATYKFTEKTYSELVAEGKLPHTEDKGKGTYCHPVTENNMLMKHNTSRTTYLRVYKTKDASMFGSTLYEIYDAAKQRMTEEAYSAWIAEYGKDGCKSRQEKVVEVFNIKTDNIALIYRGDTVIYSNPKWGWVIK